MNDLFGPAVARKTDPETSHQAAEVVTPGTKTIRTQVEAYAFGRNDKGFIDEELSRAAGEENKSSYRTRRAELTEAGVIVDSGRRRQNDGGRDCIVWVHRDFAQAMPPQRVATVDDRTKENAAKVARLLDELTRQMRAEGRTSLAIELQDAATLARAWTI